MEMVYDKQELRFVEKVNILEEHIPCLSNQVVPNAIEKQFLIS
jgi:hypothetical protein